MKNALKHALELNTSEIADRVRRNLEFSTRLTTLAWATQVLNDLKSVEKSDDPNDTEKYGFGTGFRVMGIRANFQPLNVTDVSKTYRTAHHRLILLDWGGTLVAENQKNENLHAYAISQGQTSHRFDDAIDKNDTLKQTLEALCSDVKNIVFVISGKEMHLVSDFFNDYKGLGLAAEHGCFYRWPRVLSDVVSSNGPNSSSNDGLIPGSGSVGCPISPSSVITNPGVIDRSVSATPPMVTNINSSRIKWKSMVKVGNKSWKEVVKKVMDIYTKRTHGTYIEKKENSLIWQFRDADPEFGYMQSKELEEHLKDLLSGYNSVEILRGGGGGVSDGYIEVRLAGLSKGQFLLHALDIMKSMDMHCDFLLAIGKQEKAFRFIC